MEFTVERESLLKQLQLIAGVVEKHQALPILSHILLKIENNHLLLSGTDLEIELDGKVELKSVRVPGEMTVPAAMFLQICRSLPEGAVIDITEGENSVIVKSGRSRFTLLPLDPAAFPRMEISQNVGEITLLQSDLRNLIERTHFAMAMQDVRYFLNGLLFDINQTLMRCVATDGHRMAMNAMPSKITLDPVQLIVPRKAVVELLRLLATEDEPIRMCIGENHISWCAPHFTFTSKLIDGKFPDFEKVIPKVSGKEIIVSRENFKQALGRVAILANEKLRGVGLKLSSGKMVIFAQNNDKHAAEEEVECQYTGEPLNIGFNVNYLTDFLNAAVSPEIKLTLTQAEGSALMEETSGSQWLYVAMPMRL